MPDLAPLDRLLAAAPRLVEADQLMLATFAERLVRKGAGFAKGKSEQDVETPDEFIAAVTRRFGPLTLDLAASNTNAKCVSFIDTSFDSLKQDWRDLACGQTCWLNPPFGHIGPWVKKCADEARRGTRIILLTPAAVGAKWFREHVQPNALVLQLHPRLKFVGHEFPYPKDLFCSAFGLGREGTIEPWNWRAA